MLILINESEFLHIELDIIDMNAYILVLKLRTIGLSYYITTLARLISNLYLMNFQNIPSLVGPRALLHPGLA